MQDADSGGRRSPDRAPRPPNGGGDGSRKASGGVSNLWMAVGLVAGLALGGVASATGWPGAVALAEGVAPLGDLFVRAIRMVVIPLVATTVFAGVVQLGSPARLGRLGGGALLFFWVTTALGIVIGMALMGAASGLAPAVPPPADAGGPAPEVPGLISTLVELVPPNPIGAAAEGRLLPLLVFTVLFAAAASALEPAHRDRLRGLADAASEALIVLVRWILWTAPVGIFALAASMTADLGLAVLASLAVFVGAVLVGLAVLVVGVFMPAVVFLGRVAPGRFIRATTPGAILGFGSTSSMAALPALLEGAEDELGLPESVASVVLTLAASINRAGSALFQGAAVVLLASLYGVAMPLPVLMAVFVAVFLASMTVAPIPSASIFTLTPALAAAGIPASGLGLLLGIDRLPDMFRTGANQVGHMAAAVVVGRGAPEPMETEEP